MEDAGSKELLEELFQLADKDGLVYIDTLNKLRVFKYNKKQYGTLGQKGLWHL